MRRGKAQSVEELSLLSDIEKRDSDAEEDDIVYDQRDNLLEILGDEENDEDTSVDDLITQEDPTIDVGVKSNARTKQGCSRYPLETLWCTFEVLTSNWSNILLAVVPFSFLVFLFPSWGGTAQFVLALLSLVPLGWALRFAVDQIEEAYNPAPFLMLFLRGVLGNLQHIIVAIIILIKSKYMRTYQLQQLGMLHLLECYMLGTIISKVLLIFGMSVFVAGCKKYVASLKITTKKPVRMIANMALGLLFLVGMPLSLSISISVDGGQASRASLVNLSRYTSFVIMCLYPVFYAVTIIQPNRGIKWVTVHDYKVLGKIGSIVVFTLAVSLIGFEGYILAEGIAHVTEPASIGKKGWGEKYTFIGMILLPIVSQGGLFLVTVKKAMKNKMDEVIPFLYLGCIQTLILSLPILVILGWCLNVPMALASAAFPFLVTLGAIVMSRDMISHYELSFWDGAFCVGCYIAVILGAYFHPFIRPSA